MGKDNKRKIDDKKNPPKAEPVPKAPKVEEEDDSVYKKPDGTVTEKGIPSYIRQAMFFMKVCLQKYIPKSDYPEYWKDTPYLFTSKEKTNTKSYRYDPPIINDDRMQTCMANFQQNTTYDPSHTNFEDFAVASYIVAQYLKGKEFYRFISKEILDAPPEQKLNREFIQRNSTKQQFQNFRDMFCFFRHVSEKYGSMRLYEGRMPRYYQDYHIRNILINLGEALTGRPVTQGFINRFGPVVEHAERIFNKKQIK